MDKQLSLESAVFILAFGSSQRKTIGGDFRVCNNKSCGKYVCFSFVDVFFIHNCIFSCITLHFTYILEFGSDYIIA